MSTLPLSGINSRFFSAIPLSRFSLKMSRFFCVFGVGKMRSMHSAQSKVELRRLGNHLPVLGKANLFCKVVKLCVFCLFVKLRLSLGREWTRDKDIPDYRNCGKIHVPSRPCTEVPVAPPGGGKNTNSRFFVHSVPLFSFADVDTYAILLT